MGKTIGILGGMGPLATADLFRKITLLTDAACDNEHIRVYIDSNARIPDRTAAILSGGPDPVPEMASALRSLERCGCGLRYHAVQHRALFPSPPAGHDKPAVSQYARGYGEDMRKGFSRPDRCNPRNEGHACNRPL